MNLPDPTSKILLGDGTDEKGWWLFHLVGVFSIVDEYDCSFERAVEMLTDLSIRHVIETFGISDYFELNFLIRKYKPIFVFLEGGS